MPASSTSSRRAEVHLRVIRLARARSDRRPRTGRASVPHGARIVFVLGALAAIGSVSIDMYLPALPSITRDLRASASETQLTLTSCLLGLAAGQVLIGSLSDRLGRRRPLLAGIALFVVASAACALATSVPALIVLRFVQGFAGAGGIVVGRAVVADLYPGPAAARFFSLLMLVTGVAPIAGPVLGGAVLTLTSWRGIFIGVAVLGLLLLLLTSLGLQETLPAEHRRQGGMRDTGNALRGLFANRRFLGYALVTGLMSGAVFSYVAGSPFVLQNIYGASPQLYGAIFGCNAVGMVVASQINGWLVGRTSPRVLLRAGLLGSATGGIMLLGATVAGTLGVWSVVLPLMLLMTSAGFVLPNTMALGLAEQSRAAGSASALMGVFQFTSGAAIAPLVGIAGKSSALPMAIAIATLSAGALTAMTTLTRPGIAVPVPGSA
jgi:DHA1 family bicyclomycin/chloramphenicol resistance-like MFS transporter